MEQGIGKLAADWIAYARLGPNHAPKHIFADGWELVEWARDDPAMAWEAITQVIRHYPEPEYYAAESTEAQAVVGLLAAGPLEDIFMMHGERFIGLAEAEARCDRRMAWALGGVWQCDTPEGIWMRIQQAADYSWWQRASTE